MIERDRDMIACWWKRDKTTWGRAATQITAARTRRKAARVLLARLFTAPGQTDPCQLLRQSRDLTDLEISREYQ